MSVRTTRFVCGHEGCNEGAFFEVDNRAHYADLQRRYGLGKWKCTRHSTPDQVLSPSELSKTHQMRVFKESHGMFWGIDKAINGFAYGPGFKAYAKDFPEGTVLEVTARIILPKPTPITEGEK